MHSMQASAGDVLEIELGLRQLQELGVEAAVMAALAEQARVQRLTIQLPPVVPVSGGLRTAWCNAHANGLLH